MEIMQPDFNLQDAEYEVRNIVSKDINTGQYRRNAVDLQLLKEERRSRPFEGS